MTRDQLCSIIHHLNVVHHSAEFANRLHSHGLFGHTARRRQPKKKMLHFLASYFAEMEAEDTRAALLKKDDDPTLDEALKFLKGCTPFYSISTTVINSVRMYCFRAQWLTRDGLVDVFREMELQHRNRMDLVAEKEHADFLSDMSINGDDGSARY